MGRGENEAMRKNALNRLGVLARYTRRRIASTALFFAPGTNTAARPQTADFSRGDVEVNKKRPEGRFLLDTFRDTC